MALQLHRGGYALVLALVLMSFIVSLLIFLSAHTTTSLLSNNSYDHRQKARDNALLALNHAIAQVQKHTGRDGGIVFISKDKPDQLQVLDLHSPNAEAITLPAAIGNNSARIGSGGRYAYAVFDESAKASLMPQKELPVGLWQNLSVPTTRTLTQDVSIKESILAKISSNEQLAFAVSNPEVDLPITIWTRHVLCNVTTQTLQHDLSAYLQGKGGLNDNDPMFEPMHSRAPAPLWRQLFDFSQPLQDNTTTPTAPIPFNRPTPGLSTSPIPTLPTATHPLSPVIAGVRFAYEPELVWTVSEAEESLSLRIHARCELTLWNPWRHTIAPAEYRLTIATPRGFSEYKPLPFIKIHTTYGEAESPYIPTPDVVEFPLQTNSNDPLLPVHQREFSATFTPGQVQQISFPLVALSQTIPLTPSATYLRLELAGGIDKYTTQKGSAWNDLYLRLSLIDAQTGTAQPLQEVQQLTPRDLFDRNRYLSQPIPIPQKPEAGENSITSAQFPLNDPALWFSSKRYDRSEVIAGLSTDQRWLANNNPRAAVQSRTYNQQIIRLVDYSKEEKTNWYWRSDWSHAPGDWNNPFDFSSIDGLILYERVAADRLLSLAQFQHTNLIPYAYTPSYVIGNAQAHPQIPRNKTASHGTIAPPDPKYEESLYDYSYLLNEALWDRFFLTGTGNSQNTHNYFQLVDETSTPAVDAFQHNASKLLIRCSLNVNTASEEAWLIFLTLNARIEYDNQTQPIFTFPRYTSGTEPTHAPLTMAQMETLAHNIHVLSLERRPFTSIADFVNRRLIAADGSNESTQGIKGVLQAAIDASAEDRQDWFAPERTIGWIDDEHASGNPAYGLPDNLTQADLLQAIGPFLRVRSDTFRIRAYGESPNAQSSTQCEAIIQRSPDYMNANENHAYDPREQLSPENALHGRRYNIQQFRWLD